MTARVAADAAMIDRKLGGDRVPHAMRRAERVEEENGRLKRELGVRLRFPDVEATLRDCLSTASHIPGNR